MVVMEEAPSTPQERRSVGAIGLVNSFLDAHATTTICGFGSMVFSISSSPFSSSCWCQRGYIYG